MYSKLIQVLTVTSAPRIDSPPVSSPRHPLGMNSTVLVPHFRFMLNDTPQAVEQETWMRISSKRFYC